MFDGAEPFVQFRNIHVNHFKFGPVVQEMSYKEKVDRRMPDKDPLVS